MPISLTVMSSAPDKPAVCVESLDNGDLFIAASPAMHRLRRHIAQVAGIDVPLLLLGESGSGKEVAARLAHQLSERRHRGFLKVNCAAMPAELLESELFGYEAGAFTGASRAKPGKFEMCHKGTMFLDEIGELPPALQAKLLQVLEDQQFYRLGGRSLVSVDVRVIAATNIDMESALASGRFRQDLYYRLNGVPLCLPPLRERREEIVPLLEHFLARCAEQLGRPPMPMTPALVAACLRHCWPGNVRELRSFVQRYLILRDERTALADLARGVGLAPENVIPFPEPRPPTGQSESGNAPGTDLKKLVRELKRHTEARAIQREMDQTRGDFQEVARTLGISRKALRYKIRQYGIRMRPHRPVGDAADGTVWSSAVAREGRALDYAAE